MSNLDSYLFRNISITKLVLKILIAFFIFNLISKYTDAKGITINILFSITLILLCLDTLDKRNISIMRLIGKFPNKKSVLKIVGMTSLVAIFALSIVCTYFYVLSIIQPEYLNNLINGTFKTKAILNLAVPRYIFAVLIAPFTEELFFRGVLVNIFSERYGTKMALILSTIIFSSSHLERFIAPLFIGYVLGLIYVHSGRLIYSIVLHSFINVIANINMIMQLFRKDESNSVLYISINELQPFFIYGVCIFCILIPVILYYLRKYQMSNSYDSPYFRIMKD